MRKDDFMHAHNASRHTRGDNKETRICCFQNMKEIIQYRSRINIKHVHLKCSQLVHVIIRAFMDFVCDRDINSTYKMSEFYKIAVSRVNAAD